MVISQLILYCTFIHIESQPLWFNEHSFELDGFEVNRGYFRSLNTKQDCLDHNDGNCIYSNFLNPPNLLYIPDDLNSFKSSFKLAPDEAVVIAGFAPPLSDYFTITPYVANINDNKIYASISNHSLHLNSTWFVAIVSGDLYTIDSIADWFRDANTSLTTSIYNNYIYKLPIVQSNPQLNVDDSVDYSIVIRHETSKLKENELELIYSQAPALLSWHIKVLNFSETESNIVTELKQMKAVPQTDEYELDLPVPNMHSHHHHQIGQDAFSADNYDSALCLSSLQNCNWDEPESIVFKSTVFKIGYNANIFVSGINHINTNNAVYCTINLIDALDNSIIAQIHLNDIENELHYYIVMFSDDCANNNHKWFGEDIMYCHDVDEDILVNNEYLSITEMSSSSSNDGIDISYIQPPHVVIKHSSNSNKHTGLGNTNTQNDERPNIILVMLDDLGWRDVGFNGAEYTTSNIDSLAMTGVRLNQWYVHPICTPTRAALYTGRYGFRYNLTIPLDIGQRRYIPPSVDVLQEILSSNGYNTHLVGKWHVGNSHWNVLPLERGFNSFYGFSNGFIDYYSHLQTWDLWSGSPYPRISGDNNLRLLNAFFPEGLFVYDFFDEQKLVFNNEYYPNLFSQRVTDIITSKTVDSEPFYLFYSMGTPHLVRHNVVNTPQNFSECDLSLQMYDEDRYNYCNMIQVADRAIGDMVHALKANGIWNNTIIMITSDNGPDTVGNNVPLRGIKASPFEGGNRVIGFINGGYIDRYSLNGTINNKMYHVVDLYETIINGMAGIDIDFSNQSLDSLNVWDSIVYENVSSPRTEWVTTINFGASPTAIRMGDWKYIAGSAGGLARKDGYWNVNDVTVAPGQDEGETEYLFNIPFDEEEYVNLKDESDGINVIEYLKERLEEVQDEGFTQTTTTFEMEGFVIAMLNGVALPYLDLTQEIQIDP